MEDSQNKIDRRNFLKAVGAAGLASTVTGTTTRFALTGAVARADDSHATEKKQKPEVPQVPKRKLGKTGLDVACLCLGTGTPNLLDSQIVLRNAFRLGVTCWDTASDYTWGNSELGIGKYLSKAREAREELFIISKPPDISTPIPDVADIEKHLQTSLKRMNTNYIDLYLGVHNIRDLTQLTDELKQWAENAKKRKVIRLFGFSTHKNMPQCLAAASKLDWIDAIMTVHNFRLMQDLEMQAAVEACHKAGIGIIAMKTQTAGLAAWWAGHAAKVETEADKKLVKHFQKRGFTEGQAKIKVVLEDKRFSSVCVGMENVRFLNSNVAAVLDNTKLSRADMEIFKEYARATCRCYCAGFAHICDLALPDTPYVNDIMRCLMYYNSYGQHDRARELFARIPGNLRNRLLDIDYRFAEDHCSQHLPISELVAEAVSKLA